jgi:hypothetical protein
MTQPNLSDTIAFLARSPGALSALLRDLPDAWTHRNEGERTWTVVDVVGHLIYGEQTDWMPRARLILEHGDSRAFEPFDMMGHIQVCEGKSLDGLLDEFAWLRAAIRHSARLRCRSCSRPGPLRPDPPPSALPDRGAPISGGGGAVGRIPRRDAVRRA